MPGQLRTIPLCIAAAGMTVDGREITENDIYEMVETHDIEEYGVRINIDHYADWSGYKAEVLSSIKLNGGMLGDVISLEAEKNDKGVLLLKAVISPNASYVQLNQADQHVYFSVEIDRDFCESGKTRLTGLAVTDYPASRYTSRAKFNKNQGIENKDVSFLRADLGLHDQQSEQAKKPSFMSKLFSKDESMPLTDQDKADIGKSVAEALTPAFTQLGKTMAEFSKQNQQDADGQQEEGQGTDAQNKELTEQLTKLNDKFDKQGEELKELKDKFTELEKAPHDETPADDEPHGEVNDQYKVL